MKRDIFDKVDSAEYARQAKPGLTAALIEKIVQDKGEPDWMKEIRLRGWKLFQEKKLPQFGPDLSGLKFDGLIYYLLPGEIKGTDSWDSVSPEIKATFERLGIPEAERAYLAGAGAQYESVNVYHHLQQRWQSQGVIFLDMDEAIREYPDIVRQYFMTKCVPIGDHKFSALHAAVWSGGSFIYVPKGVKVTQPLQAYFRMNARNLGQFEHTLIIMDEGSEAHYIEGCSAPKYDSGFSLHAGCVEIILKKNAKLRYSSVENWSHNTYNLNTKRAIVEAGAHMEWVGGNFGSGITMLYPCSILKGRGASCEHLGLAFANKDQQIDTGAKVYHLASDTSSRVVMKSVSKAGGRSTYRGLLQVAKNATNITAASKCDALILDDQSVSETIPDIQVSDNNVLVSHEASVGKVGEEQLLYLMSRGLTREEAMGMIVNGFVDPVMKQLPLEYSVELNRLIELEMEGIG
ncbi:MAG: Fe-S cluster assembly protein SufB [Candidatus Komeilibacteria bacterium]